MIGLNNNAVYSDSILDTPYCIHILVRTAYELGVCRAPPSPCTPAGDGELESILTIGKTFLRPKILPEPFPCVAVGLLGPLGGEPDEADEADEADG